MKPNTPDHRYPRPFLGLPPMKPPFNPPPLSQSTANRRPLSPLPGSEEARQRTIAEASARIKQQLNLTESNSSEDMIERVQSMPSPFNPSPIPFNHSDQNICARTVFSKTPEQVKKSVRKKQNVQKDRIVSVQELRNKIINQFTSMSKSRIQNLVNNPGSTKYDAALQHLVRDMRINLSSELRNMYTNKETNPCENDAMINHFNSLVPDLGIELASLPETLVDELSNILQLDINVMNEEQTEEAEECPALNDMIEPEHFFKQAEQMLSNSTFDLSDEIEDNSVNISNIDFTQPPPNLVPYIDQSVSEMTKPIKKPLLETPEQKMTPVVTSYRQENQGQNFPPIQQFPLLQQTAELDILNNKVTQPNVCDIRNSFNQFGMQNYNQFLNSMDPVLVSDQEDYSLDEPIVNFCESSALDRFELPPVDQNIIQKTCVEQIADYTTTNIMDIPCPPDSECLPEHTNSKIVEKFAEKEACKSVERISDEVENQSLLEIDKKEEFIPQNFDVPATTPEKTNHIADTNQTSNISRNNIKIQFVFKDLNKIVPSSPFMDSLESDFEPVRRKLSPKRTVQEKVSKEEKKPDSTKFVVSPEEKIVSKEKKTDKSETLKKTVENKKAEKPESPKKVDRSENKIPDKKNQNSVTNVDIFEPLPTSLDEIEIPKELNKEELESSKKLDQVAVENSTNLCGQSTITKEKEAILVKSTAPADEIKSPKEKKSVPETPKKVNDIEIKDKFTKKIHELRNQIKAENIEPSPSKSKSDIESPDSEEYNSDCLSDIFGEQGNSRSQNSSRSSSVDRSFEKRCRSLDRSKRNMRAESSSSDRSLKRNRERTKDANRNRDRSRNIDKSVSRERNRSKDHRNKRKNVRYERYEKRHHKRRREREKSHSPHFRRHFKSSRYKHKEHKEQKEAVFDPDSYDMKLETYR